MKILVTGSNGLLGYKLITLLSNKPEIKVIASARKPLMHLPEDIEFRILDITNADQTLEIISIVKPDVVINTAAMTQVDHCETERDACWTSNVKGVENLVEACKKNNIRLIQVSTDFIFEGNEGPLDEQAIPHPVNYYGESKLAGEKIIQNSSINWAILRTVLVYGITPDLSRSNIVLWVKNSLEAGKSIQVVNDQWRTPTLAEDLAMGCYLAAIKGATGIYHISGDEMMTPYDIAIQTAEYFKLNKELITATDSTKFKQPAKRPLRTGFIIEKAKRNLGYNPHTFKEGLQVLASQL